MAPTLGSRPAKDALFDSFARVAASLSSGRRLEIIDVLAQAPRTVEEVAEAIGQSVANTSHHLRRLAEDGLVIASRSGRHVSYRLASDHVFELWQALQDVAAGHHREVEARAVAYHGDRSEIDQIDWESLRERLERGEDILLIDVRPESEYEAGHLPGAIAVPPDRLDQFVSTVEEGREVVAYCRGRYCAFADQAVRKLRAAGRRASRLESGYRELHRG